MKVFKSVVATCLTLAVPVSTTVAHATEVAPARRVVDACGWANSKQWYSVDLGWFGTHRVIDQTLRSDACENDRNITKVWSPRPNHTCNKVGVLTFANRIDRDTGVGEAGVPRTSVIAQCDFKGGFQIKGIGFEVVRNLFMRQVFFIRGGALWVAKSEWTRCC